MSSTSGITANCILLEAINDLNSEGSSLVAGINDECTHIELLFQFESLQELKDYVSGTENKAAYIIAKNPSGSLNFVNYTPDDAPIRQKMVYASSSGAFQRQIGSDHIKSVTLITQPNEVLEINDEKDNGPKPYTESELLHQEIESQIASQSHSMHRAAIPLFSQNNPTLSFGIINNESRPLEELLNGENNTLVFEIDTSSEKVVLTGKLTIRKPRELISAIKTSNPTYTLYKQSQSATLVYFVYACPSGSKVKQRLMYAANKQGFINHLQEKEHLTKIKTIEIGDPKELELSVFDDPNKDIASATVSHVNRERFPRPKGPSVKKVHE